MKKSTKIKIWAFLMRLGSSGGCHQMEERSFKIKGWQFPICSRCTGILTGQILGAVLYLYRLRIPFYFDIGFLLIMFLDWFIQYKNIRQSTNFRRFLTGNLAGIAQMSILIKFIAFVLSLI